MPGGDCFGETPPIGCVRGGKQRSRVFEGVSECMREGDAHGKVGPLKFLVVWEAESGVRGAS